MNSSNSKGDLIARLAALGMGLPSFEAQASGPAHDHTFYATVTVDGQVLGSGEGRNRREAERAASLEALRALGPAPTKQGAAAPATTKPATEKTEDNLPYAPQTPWPIYAQVLAAAVEAALEFAAEDASLGDVQQDAAQFYRGLMAELGHDPAGQP